MFVFVPFEVHFFLNLETVRQNAPQHFIKTARESSDIYKKREREGEGNYL
jgi:hypothetical protein